MLRFNQWTNGGIASYKNHPAFDSMKLPGLERLECSLKRWEEVRMQGKVEICGVNTAKLQVLKNEEMTELL